MKPANGSERQSSDSLKESLRKAAKRLEQRYALYDIILFGSAARGSDHPHDIDVLILFKDKVDPAAAQELRHALPDIPIAPLGKTIAQSLEPSFTARDSILFEGISLINGEPLAHRFGYEGMGLFLTDTSALSNTGRTKFYYALNGRGAEGMLQLVDGVRVAGNTFMVPAAKTEGFSAFLERQDVSFRMVPQLVPTRLAKARFLSTNEVS